MKKHGYAADHAGATEADLLLRRFIAIVDLHHFSYVSAYVRKSAGAEHPRILHRMSAALQAAVCSYLMQQKHFVMYRST